MLEPLFSALKSALSDQNLVSVNTRLDEQELKRLKEMTGVESDYGALRAFVKMTLDAVDGSSNKVRQNNRDAYLNFLEKVGKKDSSSKDPTQDTDDIVMKIKRMLDEARSQKTEEYKSSNTSQLLAYGAYAQKNLWETFARSSYGAPPRIELINYIINSGVEEAIALHKPISATLDEPLNGGWVYMIHGLKYGGQSIGLDTKFLPPANLPNIPLGAAGPRNEM